MLKKCCALLLMCCLLFCAVAQAEDVQWPTLADHAQMKTTIQRVTDEPITLTMWMGMSSQDVTNVVGDIQNLDILKTLEEKTGVHLELLVPPVGEDASNFSLMMASGKYADIIIGFENNYAKGSEAAIEEGIILDLKDLVEQYAPNYQAVRTFSRFRTINTVTDSGLMPWMCNVTWGDKPSTTYGGPIIRKDLLDKLGMEMPVTLDDWHEYLTRCKNELGMTRGLGLANTGIAKYNAFNSAFGFGMRDAAQGGDFYLKDGKVCYGALDEGYLQYVTLMAQWYAEGLIDPDFTSTITFDDGIAMMSSDLCAATSEHSGVLDYVNSLGKAVNPDFNFVAAPYPVLNEGDQLHYGFIKSASPIGKAAVITSSCEHPEIAVKFLDQLYTDEGFMLCNYGTLGKSYELVDGVPQYTELITNNDLGTITHMMCAYAAHISWPFEGVLGRDDTAGVNAHAEVWDANNDYSWSLPGGITLSVEEKETYSDLYPDIQTYADEMTVKFIMGIEPLENYATFVETLKEMGIEQILAGYQAAYDRYASR